MKNSDLYRMNDAELLIMLRYARNDVDDGSLSEADYRERVELITGLLHGKRSTD